MAASTRTSTFIDLAPPTRVTSPSWSARSILACAGEREVADFVQEEGAAVGQLELAGRSAKAPVNDPFMCPKSSLSISSLGMAAQLTSMNGPCRRGLAAWMARATSSLPLPFSPVISTRAAVGPTLSIRARTPCSAGLEPTMACAWSAARLNRWFSVARTDRLSALRTVTSSRSLSSGFSRKSKAPRCVASTAVAMVPWPEIMTTVAVGSSSRSRVRVSRPSRPAIFTSRKTRCGRNSG